MYRVLEAFSLNATLIFTLIIIIIIIIISGGDIMFSSRFGILRAQRMCLVAANVALFLLNEI